MLAKVTTILHENTLCVLCTELNGNPHCSLMTYLLSDDLKVLYLVSTRESRKYQNLLTNPRVSVLVDTRQRLGTNPAENIVSVTFEGLFHPLADPETQIVRIHLAQAHPELNAILKNPDCVIFGIHLKSFLLLDGPVDSYQGDL
ncbi:MAG: pyridoxamine 5'-phosphate oxidase family protein [Acetobacterium sp.]|nr:pyridoxamine 5'-phosphate oxidase family protein [Bacillota bacterium]MCG2729011.1 pyridoxamine 5'-phosphate oxidase family protein [Acetobacterium sp.]